jgi:nitrite reductase/ring-hydroxylating ferredoxin subunit
MPLVRVASVEDLPEAAVREVRAGGSSIALVQVDGEIRAFQGNCPHLNGPLGHGNFVEGVLICPWHAWEFDGVSGAALHNPAVRLRRYPVVVQDGQILLDLG